MYLVESESVNESAGGPPPPSGGKVAKPAAGTIVKNSTLEAASPPVSPPYGQRGESLSKYRRGFFAAFSPQPVKGGIRPGHFFSSEASEA